MKSRLSILAILTLLAAGCGGSNPEVWLQVLEDGSHPCLGASHLRVKVNLPGQTPEEVTFDEFGLFFDTENFGCTLVEEFRFPDLPLGSNVWLELSLSDSTTEDKGVVAEGASIAFDVSGGSPIQEVTINLFRNPGVLEGTLVVNKPGDWGNVSGIQSLQFRITKDGETTPARAYYFTYDPVTRPEPFPLIISNLPTPDELEMYMFQLDGLDDQLAVLRSWTGYVYLQRGQISYLTLGF
jgi:hypothetical protein